MMQRERAVATTLSIYVGLVFVQLFTQPVGQFFSGERTINSFFVNSHVSPFSIQAAIFLITILLVTTKSGIVSGRESSSSLLSPFEVMAYAFLNTALIVTTILSYLPDAVRTSIIEQSKMASYLTHYHTLWLLLPIAALVFFGWNRRPAWQF